MCKARLTSALVIGVLSFLGGAADARDLNELSRGGGRSVEFLDQINKASLVMLDGAGLMAHPIAARIGRGLETVIAQEHETGGQRSADYLDFEPKLLAVVGPDASRLHIGRSRQDMGATIARMSLRDNLIKELDALAGVRDRLIKLADDNKTTIIPAFTHGVQAQPTTLAHYLLAFAYALDRNGDRLREAYRRVNQSPLGAAALGTSSFPIDRNRLAELLGFDGLIVNSYDANHVAPVDSSLEVAGALEVAAVQLGQFAQDINAQYAEPAPWFLLSEGKLTGVSSIMPQKRNPAALEQLRTQSSLMISDMQSVALLAHNTRTGAFDYRAYDPVPSERPLLVLNLMQQILDGFVVDKTRALVEVNSDYSTTTEIADTLSRTADVPFRIGHHFASTLTNYGRSHGLKLTEIPYADVTRIYKGDAKQDLPLTEAEFKDAISPEHMIGASKGIGGPQLAEVERMLKDQRAKLTGDRDWLTSETERLAKAQAALTAAIQKLAEGTESPTAR
jgi:argininosuccinate lyase